jgi:hypothetical protein
MRLGLEPAQHAPVMLAARWSARRFAQVVMLVVRWPARSLA